MSKKATPKTKSEGKASKPKKAAMVAEAMRPTAAAPEPAAQTDAPSRATGSGFDAGAFTGAQRAQIEQLSMNLARAALTAQGTIAEMALRQADRPAALSSDPFHVGPALTQVMGRLAAQPERVMRAQADLFSRYLNLWQSSVRRMSGETPEPVVSPAKGDKRFLDADWSDNPVFDTIKQSYLLTSNWLNELVSP